MVSIHSNRIVPNWSLNLPYERAAIVELNFIKAKMLNLPKWGLKPKWFRFCHPENPKSGFIDITTIGVLIWKGRLGRGNYFDSGQKRYLRRMYKRSLRKLNMGRSGDGGVGVVFLVPKHYVNSPSNFWSAKIILSFTKGRRWYLINLSLWFFVFFILEEIGKNKKIGKLSLEGGEGGGGG